MGNLKEIVVLNVGVLFSFCQWNIEGRSSDDEQGWVWDGVVGTILMLKLWKRRVQGKELSC